MLRASGHPQKAMMATITTVIINVLLAPLFIFVFDSESVGAATATVCAQLIVFSLAASFVLPQDELIRLKEFSFERKIVMNRFGYWYVSLSDEYDNALL